MQAARDWALSLCAVAVLGAVFDILKPGGRYDKILRLLLAAVMICAVISPLTDLRGCSADIGEITDSMEQPGSEFADAMIARSSDAMRDALSAVIGERLADMGIDEYEISISMDTSPDGSISIGQVDIKLDPRYAGRCAEVRDMTDALGISADVTSGGQT